MLHRLLKTRLGAQIRFAATSFQLNTKSYSYFAHPYNHTWLNERAVEVPIVWQAVKTAITNNKTILELGNVLPHYFQTHHDVIDKYELAEGVINQDIVSFSPKKKYDLIVGISTLEHIGWDEPKKEKSKIPKTLKKLRSLLKKNGQAILTFPLGHNAYLDDLAYSHKLDFDQLHWLHRVSWDNRWKQIETPPNNTQYNQPFCNANVIGVGTVLKK